MRYTLNDDREPVPCPDLIEWAMWFDKPENIRVAQDTVHGLDVSTVFLGLDYGKREGKPVLFETMIFTSVDTLPFQTHYTCWDDAVAGHKLAIAYLEASLPVG